MKKLMLLCVTVAMMFTMFAFTASADDGARGEIAISSICIVSPDKYRNDSQYPSYAAFQWAPLPYWNNGEAELYRKGEDGEVLIGSFKDKHQYTFSGLEDGVYVIRFPFLQTGNYALVHGVYNGTELLSNLITDDGTEIEIINGSQVKCHVVVEHKAFAFRTTTHIGHFGNGTQTKDFFPTTTSDGLRNWAIMNPNNNSSYAIINTHSGIYYGDSADVYKGMNSLEEPVPNEEEKAKGYRFVGWKLQGDNSGKLYSDDEARSHIITKDTTFEAVWEYPRHTVTFKTNKDYGTLQPSSNEKQTSYSYNVDFNNQKIGELSDIEQIPQAEPKEGYTFEGWYMDLSMETLSDDEINDITVDKDITLYAKYRPANDKTSDPGDDTSKKTADNSGDTGEQSSKDKGESSKAKGSSDGPEDKGKVTTSASSPGKKVSSAGKSGGSPATGDASGLIAICVLCAAALAAFIALLVKRHRNAD